MKPAIKIITILTAGLFLSLASSVFGEVEHEILLGTYLTTLRNLNTRGTTLAYRCWLTRAGAERRENGFSVFYPFPLIVGFEVRTGYLTRPDEGLEGALMLNLRYQPVEFNKFVGGLFLGTGASYSDMNYEKVATHLNFINRGGIYLGWNGCILQSAYEHRSNGHLCSHNRGLDVITASLGYRF